MTTQQLYDEVKFEEGEKLKAYKDRNGIWSIGIGHNIEVDPTLQPQLNHLIAEGITQEQSQQLFATDMQKATADLDKHLPWWRQLDDIRQDAVVNIVFNRGINGFLAFHHTVDALQQKQYALAARNLLATKPWSTEIPERAKRIANQIETGVSQYTDLINKAS